MKKKLKITKTALIGAGTMAQYHLDGYRAAGAEVVAVADMNDEKGAEFARKHKLPGGAYHDLDEMLAAHPEIQAVSVITPNKFHYPVVMDALKKGLHVFCEKPPALNAKEMMKMAAFAEKQKLTLMFDLNNRARLDSVEVKKMIDEGKFGAINSAQAVWQRRAGIPGFGGWFTTKALAGGGPLIDLLHMIDLALYFMGYPEPEYVLAQTFDDFIHDPKFQGTWGKPVSNTGTTDVESACHGFVRFKTGQVLSFHNSWAELVSEELTFVALQGKETGLHIQTVNDVNQCEFYKQLDGVSDDRVIRFTNDRDMGRTRMPGNFIRALNGEEKPLSTAAEAVKLMKLIDAVYLSASSGKPVKVLKNSCKVME